MTAITITSEAQARKLLEGVRTGQFLTDDQMAAQLYLASLTPDCPLDDVDGAHNIDDVSAPFTRGGTTFVHRQCTCGLDKGRDYVVSRPS